MFSTVTSDRNWASDVISCVPSSDIAWLVFIGRTASLSMDRSQDVQVAVISCKTSNWPALPHALITVAYCSKLYVRRCCQLANADELSDTSTSCGEGMMSAGAVTTKTSSGDRNADCTRRRALSHAHACLMNPLRVSDLWVQWDGTWTPVLSQQAFSLYKWTDLACI